jgi:hypothetical protein
VGYLFDKGIELFLGAPWSKPDNSSKSILSNTIGLITLEDLDATDTWLAIISGEADSLLVEISIDIATAIAVLDSVATGIVA